MNRPTLEAVCPKCGKPIAMRTSYCASCGARIFRRTSGENTADPYIGQVIDNTFEVESILGTGSMGIVYKARHRALDCYVALKILKHDLITDRVALARFQREAQAASKLSHPNVIRIFHYGKTAQQAPYIVMECLEGLELGVLIPQQYPLEQRRVCSIALQVARALSAAHAANIVHRDLKPANIFVIQRAGQELVKVLDFGIAKVADIEGVGLTKEGAMCGTPAFMSPEQVTGKQVTYASDLFSLGSVMYYMLTNRLPFQGDNMVDMARAILTGSPVAPNQARLDYSVDPSLNAICMKALEKDVDRRFKSALEMVDALEKAYNTIPEKVQAPKPKIVVLGEGGSVNPNGVTQCLIPSLHPELRDNTEPGLDSDPENEVGTMVEMPAMIEDEPDEMMRTARSGIVGAIDAIGGAFSEVFEAIQVEKKPVAPDEKTTMMPSHAMLESVPVFGEEEEAENREQLLERRKSLMTSLIIVISSICILVLIGVLTFAFIRNSNENNASEDNPDPAAAVDVRKNNPSAAPSENDRPVPVSENAREWQENAGNGVLNGGVYGLTYEPPADENPSDGENTESDENGNDGTDESADDWDLSDDNSLEPEEKPAVAPKPSAPKTKAAPKPAAPSTSGTKKPEPKETRDPRNFIVDYDEVNTGGSGSKTTNTNKKAEPAKKPSFSTPPSILRRIVEAERLEKSGHRDRACSIYISLSAKLREMAQADRLKLEKKIRACKRIEI